MSNIEDDIKAKGFIEGYKQIKNKIKVLEMEEDYDYLNHKKAIEILKELLEDK